MIQATNELLLGIDLNEQYGQITYYHPSVKEPMTLGSRTDADKISIPMAVRQDAQGNWHFWDGKPELEPVEPDRCRVSDIYRKIANKEWIGEGDVEFTPTEILEIYFRLCFESLKGLGNNARLHVMVTVRELDDCWSEAIAAALMKAGVERKQIYVQDYLSSFYYYTVNQKKELWYQDVALLEYVDESIVGYVLHIDHSTRPAIARVDKIARQPMDDSIRAGRGESEWLKEKDRLFFELLKKVFERRTISVSYLVGDFFSKSWAERSIQYLCYKRHAFQGKNLYSKGACYAAMERAGLIAGRDILFGGRDMIERNLGMDMMIRGKESYYPLVSAGINWYEAHHVCEFLLNDEKQIRMTSNPMAEGEIVEHRLRLPGLPERPPRGTRVRMTVYFTSAHRCRIEVEDLGLGGLFRSSGLTWTRDIRM